MNRIALTLALTALYPLAALRAEPVKEQQRKEHAGISAGLIVHVSTTDGKLEAELATAPGWSVLGLASRTEDGAKARAYLASKGVLGRATILDWIDTRTLPLASNAAALLIADLDQLGAVAPNEKELLRGVRPLGTLRLKHAGKWTEAVKPWPKELDDWPMYFHDAAGSDVSQDTVVGPVRGLQWHTGDGSTNNRFGLRSRRGVILSTEDDASGTGKKKSSGRLVARDAFTGIKLWERNDLSLTNRYAMLLDDKRAYLHADGEQYMTTLDLATGKTVLTLDQGLDLTKATYRNIVGKAALWPQAVIHDGLLVQAGLGKLFVLEASTGRRLWTKSLGDGQVHLPTVVGDTLALVEGPQAVRSPAYLFGWNCCQLDSVAFYDLRTGKERRRWRPDAKQPHYVLHMCAADGVLALVAGTLRSGDKSQDETRVYCLDFAKGTERWSKPASELGGGGFGGHGTNLRVLIQNEKVWCTGLRAAVGYNLNDGGEPVKVNYLVSQCQPIRATTKYHFAALCAMRLEDNQLVRSEASRPACDIGPFPSNGLVYTTATNCGCHPFLSGYNAFHSEPLPEPYRGERLQRGPAQAAPVKEDAWPGETSWPMYMRDPQRSNWTNAVLAADRLKKSWETKFRDPAEGLPKERAVDWRHTEFSHAPITAPTMAEGVVVVAVTDAHEVVALDPDTGKERWRITVDGRVDSPPTIYRGLVLFGSRNGWVYAVNRDNGGLVWRFLAAPVHRQIIANGQPESTWPVFGTIVIHENLAWFYAGRGTQLDGGLHWYAVEPATGKLAKSGVLTSQEDLVEAGKKKGGYSKATLAAPPDTASPLAVTVDGKQMLMARAGLEVNTGKMLRAGVDYWFPHDTLAAHFAGSPIDFNREPGLPSCVLPRRFGLLYNGVDQAALYSVSFYGGTLAKIFAYRGGDFVALLSNNPPANRGGGPDGLKRWHTDLIGKVPPQGKQPPARLIWSAGDYPSGKKDFEQHQALVKAGDFVLVGHGAKLLVYRYDTGTRVAAYDLPDVPVHNGIAVAAGRVTICCHNGAVVCLRM